MNTLRTPVRSKRGSSLVDVIAASLLTGLVLLPSMRIMRESIQTNERLQMRQELLTHCESLMETTMHSASSSVIRKSEAGQLKQKDTTLEFAVVASDDPAMGGMAGRLTAISTIVWHDEIQNRRLDRNESHVSLYSKVAAR